MGHIIDLVPNHMAADATTNPWWRDVLTHGQRSRHASWFDIEWEASDDLDGKVLLAVLPDTYEAMLDRGAITLEARGDTVVVHAGEVELPTDPETIAKLPVDAGGGLGDLSELDTVLVDELIRRQPYRLSRWTRARTQLNYRRFFDVDGLVGLRVEQDDVFRASHELLLGWVADGIVDGLRVDHPDGLRDPGAYLARLRATAPDAWIVVEKILEEGEELVGSWPVDGTTGYDFAALATGVLVDRAARDDLVAIAGRFTGDDAGFWDIARQARHDVLRTSLVTEERRLTALFAATVEQAVAAAPTVDDEVEVGPPDVVDLRAVLTEVRADMGV
jgi:(1->4)-alpha-D-glucan 1-alpha-D-glucosylmutase